MPIQVSEVPAVLTLNAGSSSIKFAIFNADELEPLLTGLFDNIGVSTVFKSKSEKYFSEALTWAQGEAPKTHTECLHFLIDWLKKHYANVSITAVGHRVVHGGSHYSEPAIIDDTLLQALRKLFDLAPLHEPHNMTGIQAAQAAFVDVLQVACFDTAFHRGHSFVNEAYALPRELYEEGVRRYGFHGLSYEYIAHVLMADFPHIYSGKVIVCHLGNGASMCALVNGQSIASTMGFTPLDGLAMGTRCGNLDPGILLYLLEYKGLDAHAISRLLYKESGLLGLSGGLSHDMRTLEQSDSPLAKQAVDYFIHRIVLEIGSLAMAIGGIDAIVFTGGIGENSRLIRHRVAREVAWLGLALDSKANEDNATIISSQSSKITCLRIPTNEERMIANHTLALRHS